MIEKNKRIRVKIHKIRYYGRHRRYIGSKDDSKHIKLRNIDANVQEIIDVWSLPIDIRSDDWYYYDSWDKIRINDHLSMRLEIPRKI